MQDAIDSSPLKDPCTKRVRPSANSLQLYVVLFQVVAVQQAERPAEETSEVVEGRSLAPAPRASGLRRPMLKPRKASVLSCGLMHAEHLSATTGDQLEEKQMYLQIYAAASANRDCPSKNW